MSERQTILRDCRSSMNLCLKAALSSRTDTARDWWLYQASVWAWQLIDLPPQWERLDALDAARDTQPCGRCNGCGCGECGGTGEERIAS